MKRSTWCVMGAALLSALVVPAHASTTISSPLEPTWSIGPLGEGMFTVATVGQTIVVPAMDNVLNSWSVWLDDSGQNYFKSRVNFAGYVMAWDGAGSKATGSVLWKSAPQTTAYDYGTTSYQPFTFNTGGLALNPGAAYVLFVSTSEYFDTWSDRAEVGLGSPGCVGSYVFQYNGSDVSKWTGNPWMTSWDGTDLAFEATFTSGATAVPLPGAALLGVLGTMLTVPVLRRRA